MKYFQIAKPVVMQVSLDGLREEIGNCRDALLRGESTEVTGFLRWYLDARLRGATEGDVGSEAGKMLRKISELPVADLEGFRDPCMPVAFRLLGIPRSPEYHLRRAVGSLVYLDTSEKGWQNRPWNQWTVHSMLSVAMHSLALPKGVSQLPAAARQAIDLYPPEELDRQLRKKRKTREEELALAALLSGLTSPSADRHSLGEAICRALGMAYRRLCTTKSTSLIDVYQVLFASIYALEWQGLPWTLDKALEAVWSAADAVEIA